MYVCTYVATQLPHAIDNVGWRVIATIQRKKGSDSIAIGLQTFAKFPQNNREAIQTFVEVHEASTVDHLYKHH